MIGDAYFQLRAQVGTALFSLLRLAAETGAGAGALSALRTAQSGLREPFHLLALGPKGSGKSTLLNALFEREFCGLAEPVTAGKTAIFQYGDSGCDVGVAEDAVICERPHSFLRDFTVVDAAGFEASAYALQDAFVSYLPRADVLFFVVSATGHVAPDAWSVLSQLERDTLKRVVFVVWRADGVSADEGANTAKRIRQAMLKNLGQACPIFLAAGKEGTGLQKLIQWVESEIIFSPSRRAALIAIERLAQSALRDIADQPRLAEQTWQRVEKKLHELGEDLAEREAQSQRQIAGVLWRVAQSCDALRKRGESLLRPYLRLDEMLWGSGRWQAGFVSEVETQARKSLVVQVQDALGALEIDHQEAAKDFHEDSRELFPREGGDAVPGFARSKVAATIQSLDRPLDLGPLLRRECARARSLLLLPVLSAAGAMAVTLGALPGIGLVVEPALLAAGGLVFSLCLASLLRSGVLARFGQHFTANRAALLSAFEPPLREASAEFYAALAGPLEAKIAAHESARRQHEPLLNRVAQLQQTFLKIGNGLRAERSSSEGLA